MPLPPKMYLYKIFVLSSLRKEGGGGGGALTLSQTTNWKRLQTTISNLVKMAESTPNRWKTLWEKEKLLVTSNFSFSHNVFKRHVLQTRKTRAFFWEKVKASTGRHRSRSACADCATISHL